MASTPSESGPGSRWTRGNIRSSASKGGSGSGNGSGSSHPNRTPTRTREEDATLRRVSSLAIGLLLIYAVGLLALAAGGRSDGTAVDYLLAGRRLTLPAFVATLVTTWYGGILGVGEYAWRFGISTWLVFGVPYYAAALLFAFVLASRLRATDALSIPDLLAMSYGRGARITGAIGVLALAVPVAYVLMLAVLLQQLCGWSRPTAAIVAAGFSALYLVRTGFRAVVRTDIAQLVLMYGGFLVLLPAALAHVGGLEAMWRALPATSRSWDGGLGWQTVLVWYLIALQTVVEPTFYQRVFAARDRHTARRGVLVSVAMWLVFDALTTLCGLAARVALPELADPLTAYPALADSVLPPALAAVFVVTLFAIVMSTLDSYLFIAAATVGHDLSSRPLTPSAERRLTRFGLLASALAAAVLATVVDSAVTVWHHVGTVVTSALLLPVISVHLPTRWRYSARTAVVGMVAAAVVAVGWLVAGSDGRYPLGLEPMFPALAAAAAAWVADRLCSTG